MLSNLIPAEKEMQGQLRELSGNISGFRSRVSGSSDVEAVAREYSNAIGRLLDQQNEYFRKYAASSRLAGQFISIVTLESAKESLGQLRALISAILLDDKPISENTFQKLIDYRAMFSAGITSRILQLENSSGEELQRIAEGAEWEKINQTIGLIFSKAATGGFSQNGKEHFAMVTDLIDKMQATIQAELTSAEKKAVFSTSEAVTHLNFSVILILAATVISGLFSARLARSISGPVGQVAALAEAVSRGDLSGVLASMPLTKLAVWPGRLISCRTNWNRRPGRLKKLQTAICGSNSRFLHLMTFLAMRCRKWSAALTTLSRTSATASLCSIQCPARSLRPVSRSTKGHRIQLPLSNRFRPR